MRAVFLFSEDMGEAHDPGWMEADIAFAKVFTGLVAANARHLVARRGGFLVSNLPRDPTALREWLETQFPHWLAKSMSDAELHTLVSTTNLYVLAVAGMTHRDVWATHAGLLRSHPPYMGFLEIDFAFAAHWVLFEHSLFSGYRFYQTELRLLHGSELVEGDDAKPEWRAQEWRSTRIFARVTFEDIGVEGSIFDEVSTAKRAAASAFIESRLDRYLGLVNAEVTLRLRGLSVHVEDAVHAALIRLETAQSVEEFAQCALSVRRALEHLADALYPPHDGQVGDMVVTADKYRNRLKAHLSEHLAEPKAAVALLEDVYRRVSRVDQMANRMIHQRGLTVARDEIQRLVVAFIALLFDLLVTPPPMVASQKDYEAGTMKLIRRMLGVDDDNEDSPS